MRVSGKGLINREKIVNFKFDGQNFEGFEGDTVASALLASGKKLFGRWSIKHQNFVCTLSIRILSFKENKRKLWK